MDVHPIAAAGFGSSADAYERGSPEYPSAAIRWFARRVGLRPGVTVVDLADDPNLTGLPPQETVAGGGGGFADSRRPPDQPANPDQKLTYTVNLTECLRFGGKESLFDEVGEARLFGVLAVGRGGRVSHYLSFKRQ